VIRKLSARLAGNNVDNVQYRQPAAIPLFRDRVFFPLPFLFF
jgi:hypothetical protein